MFVAGIKLFFGFVAGAILLVLGIYLLTAGHFITAAILQAIADGIRKILKGISEHPGIVVGTAVYLGLMLILFDSSSDTVQGIGSLMLIGVLIVYIRWRSKIAKQSSTAKSSASRRFWA
jgi:hypothetical protein